MNCEILAIGSEMLTPFRQDTNSLYLTSRLNALGVNVIAKSVIGDRRALISSAVASSLPRTDIIVLTGGLGPTKDDLTREAVADALNIDLVRNPDILTSLYKRFADRRIPMPPNNSQQADVLRGAEILSNPSGTAPGQWIDTVFQTHRKIIILLPGVPSEMRAIFALPVILRVPEPIATGKLF